MVIHYEDPVAAAMALLNASGTTHARQVALLRAALKQTRAPLRTVRVTYGASLPVSALMTILPTFSGRCTAMLTLDEVTPTERDGFYRRHTGEYHPNSFELEAVAAKSEEAAFQLANRLISAGVNICQASDLFPMGSQCKVMLEGTLEDFADLYFEHGAVAQGSHPASRQLAIDIWADIQTRFRSFAEAYMETGR